MKNIRSIFTLLVVLAAAFLWGCGDDSTTGGNNTGGTPPTLNMKVGSLYTFNIDSLSTTGGVAKTSLKTLNTYLSVGTFFGQSNAYQILSETKDTITNISLGKDTFYVRYDGGRFYQYGVLQLISPSIPPSWDLVADFNVAFGSSFTIASNVPINIGSITGALANITGSIAADTTFNTSGWGNVGINCYRSEIVADITFSGFSIGKVYVDYYIGDADPSTNPSGMVRVKLRPVNLTVYTQSGVDQYLQRYQPGP
ncbi:MAG: hypothetical protein JNK43_02995 [Ignavibacteria bacterium]|nr:hypothetical protein [Ignavibacteria bacterium]